MITALIEAKAVDVQARNIANQKPHHLAQSNNDGRGLPSVECAARGLPSVNLADAAQAARIWRAQQTHLASHEVPLAAQVAASMAPIATDERIYGPEWCSFSRSTARPCASRRCASGEAKAEAAHTGPKWWRGEKPGPERAA